METTVNVNVNETETNQRETAVALQALHANSVHGQDVCFIAITDGENLRVTVYDRWSPDFDAQLAGYTSEQWDNGDVEVWEYPSTHSITLGYLQNQARPISASKHDIATVAGMARALAARNGF